VSTAKPPLSPVVLAHYALKQNCKISELCIMCGKRIRTAIFRGTGVCCEDCRKDRDGDHEPAQGIVPKSARPPGSR
jgi:hypothetical protein